MTKLNPRPCIISYTFYLRISICQLNFKDLIKLIELKDIAAIFLQEFVNGDCLSARVFFSSRYDKQ